MKYLTIAFMIAVTFWSCNEDTGSASLLPSFVGGSGDIVVVMPEKAWEGASGDALREIFYHSYPVLPQHETLFTLNYISPNQFDKFWKPHRNVIIADFDDRIDTQEPSVVIQKNKFANGQIYITVKAKSQADFIEAVNERAGEIISVLQAEELKRLGALNGVYSSTNIKKELIDWAGITMNIPKDARVKVKEKDFMWIDRQMTRMKGGRNHDVQEGFFIYTYPYTSDTMFSRQFLLNKRDSVLRKHVPGPVEGSYMATEYFYQPVYEEIEFKGKFAAEMRGLWKLEGDFMGGPFYSITMLDDRTGKLITVDGYAYAPYFDKREYIREVEAIIKTLQFVNPPSS